jgi:hypothetical protein
MNSLPFISHHLFVAAIGNESRTAEKLLRQQNTTATPDDSLAAIALEVIDASRRPSRDARRSLEARTNQPGA